MDQNQPPNLRQRRTNRPEGEPVTLQPGPRGDGPTQWMERPMEYAGCPTGLEYLGSIDQILAKQQTDIIETFVPWQQSNRYKLMNSVGQQIYFASEESSVFERQCCRSKRSFTMHITDNIGAEVIRTWRGCKCCECDWCACCPPCSDLITVEAPVGEIIGHVQQRCSPWPPRFSVYDSDFSEVLFLQGPYCSMIPFVDRKFTVTSPDGMEVVGSISKQWGGVLREVFTNADNFGISFPMELDVKMKAVLIGALFLIDFMYFESQPLISQLWE